MWSELSTDDSIKKIVSNRALTRLYTNSNARLHCVAQKDEDTITAGNHAAHVKLYDGMLSQNSTRVIVDYELMQLPMLSWIFSPSTIKSKSVPLTIGGEAHKVEHTTSNIEKVTLKFVAKWQAYMVTKHGQHVEVESAQATNVDGTTTQANLNTNNDDGTITAQ